MEIKRTVKPSFLGFDFPYAGQTEIIDEAKMKRVIRNTSLGFLDPQNWGTDAAMAKLENGQTLETFYATYEPVRA